MLQLPTVKVRVVLSGVTAVLAWPEMVTVTSPVGSVASADGVLVAPARHNAQRRRLYRHPRTVVRRCDGRVFETGRSLVCVVTPASVTPSSSSAAVTVPRRCEGQARCEGVVPATPSSSVGRLHGVVTASAPRSSRHDAVKVTGVVADVSVVPPRRCASASVPSSWPPTVTMVFHGEGQHCSA